MARIFSYGNPAVPDIREFASRYLSARLGINLVLWRLQALGVRPGSIASVSDLAALLANTSANAPRLGTNELLGNLATLRISIPERSLARRESDRISSSLRDMYSVRDRPQVRTFAGTIRDTCSERAVITHRRPWVVSLGPVAILALAHACLSDVSGPRSVHRFAEHLGLYGIRVDRDDLTSSDLGRQLRMLGLVLDSPDAESGMLLVPPFQVLGDTAA